MESNKEVIKLVCFGQGGHTEYVGRHGSYRNVTISGYDKPDNWKVDETRDYIPDCPVINKRDAVETIDGHAWVFLGPMVDVDLEPNAVDKCPNPSPIFAQAVAGNQFGALLALQVVADRKKPGPLDSVDVQTYIQGWKKHGAKIGKIQNGSIVWEE